MRPELDPVGSPQNLQHSRPRVQCLRYLNWPLSPVLHARADSGCSYVTSAIQGELEKETMGAPVHCACSSRYVVLASCSVLPGPILSCSATTTSKMGMRSFYYQKMLNRERTFFVLCLRGWYANAYELSDLDVICHKAKSRYIGSVITSMSPKNSPVRAHHWRPISIVRTMAKDNPNATNVHITAIACFVLIENSTILTSSALKYPC